MGTKNKQHAKWLAVAILAVLFIGIVAVQVRPRSSEAIPRIDGINSGLTEVAPRIEAICFSGSDESSICIRGTIAHVGDIVDGFRVLKIHPSRVEFEKNGKTITSVFPPARTSASPESNTNSFSGQRITPEPVGHKASDNYQKQHGQPIHSVPFVAENGSYYGQISEDTGRPKTIYVRGYYRKDGTYVRSHYRSPPISTDASRSSKTYFFTGGGHWVNKIIDRGNFIRLEDRSLWQVNPIDRIICSLWLYTEEIVVVESQNPAYPYFLINTDDKEKVEAKFISN